MKSDLINWAQESLHSNRKISSRLREIAQGNLRDNAHMSDFERQLGQNPHLISPVSYLLQEISSILSFSI